MKWFKRWGVKDLHIGALSGDDMKYVIIEDRPWRQIWNIILQMLTLNFGPDR